MKYSVLANWIRFKPITDDDYIIYNLLNNQRLKTDRYMVWFARQLNGKTDPYKIDPRLFKEDVDLILAELKDNEIIRDPRFVSKSLWALLITVWQPRVTANFRMISFFINGLLLISWLPLLIFSIFYFADNIDIINTDYMTLGTFAGLFIGLFLHEIGHMLACLAYGGKVFELGAMFLMFLPGAYVMMNERNIKTRMKRVQVSAAGVEMNLVLTALFLIFAVKFESVSGFFLGMAIQNGFLALVNMMFITGFDGSKIMGELLGTENLIDGTSEIVSSRFRKRTLKKDGIPGIFTIVVCYIFKAIQISLPVLVLLNVMGVILWFI